MKLLSLTATALILTAMQSYAMQKEQVQVIEFQVGVDGTMKQPKHKGPYRFIQEHEVFGKRMRSANRKSQAIWTTYNPLTKQDEVVEAPQGSDEHIWVEYDPATNQYSASIQVKTKIEGGVGGVNEEVQFTHLENAAAKQLYDELA